MRFGDESGLFWQDEERTRARGSKGPRALPPIPDTGWLMPTEFPNLSGQGMIALDVETKDPNLSTMGPGFIRGDAYVCGVAVGTEAGFRSYYPVAHEMGDNLPKEKVFGWLSEQMRICKDVPKIGANFKYDLEALAFEGVEVDGPIYDVQIAEPLLNENKFVYSLQSLGVEYLDEGKETDLLYQWLVDAFGKDNFKGNIYRAPATVVGPYAESDVDLPLRIFRKQKKLLLEQNLWDLFIMESKLIKILLKMRHRGVAVDLPKIEQARDEMRKQQAKELAQIKLTTGLDVDVWAADSLARVYDAAGVSYPRTAKTNKPSFTKGWLEHNNHPVSRLIKSVRHLDKFCGTFMEGYILEGNINGRLHTTFNQLKSDGGTGTVSGRFSSTGPNLQNIPTRTAEGKLIREAFIPDAGQKWYSIDWSQVEYRLIAHYAAVMRKPGAAEVVRRYLEDSTVDYHQLVADMTGLSRSNAKNLNFGLAYGQGIDLLCENLGVDRETGMKIINEYHTKAPFIRPLSKDVMQVAQQRGHIITLLGRHRRFHVWESRDGKNFSQEPLPGYRRAKTHKALNALIQGSAADVMKKAMVDIWESGVCDVIGIPQLTVHDELDGSFEPTKAGTEAINEMKRMMETTVNLKIPLLADMKTGANWGECK